MHERNEHVIDAAAISETMALGIIIAKCRDRALTLDLSFLARLLERAGLAVDEEIARIGPVEALVDHRPSQ